MVTSTNDKSILHRLKKITFEKFLGNAGKKSSDRVEGKGYIVVPGTDGRLIEIPCWYCIHQPCPCQFWDLVNSFNNDLNCLKLTPFILTTALERVT